MINIPEIFGSLVFNDAVMKQRLPKNTYDDLKDTIENGSSFDISIATVVAEAMKEWAIENGATHFSHWFQPMTGVTAEKHDGFITLKPNGRVIMEFSGSELVRGESDASSFPSGGLRATFEARGYTAWDPTSYAFIKDATLFIPTAFCSYSGEALDKKTPLLRSMQALNKQALRVLKLFGDTDIKNVRATVGAEQEYFLIDKEVFNRRPDLVYCGRTIMGAPPPKGQEIENHYYGAIKSRVADFMRELEIELWKLGVPAKTKHNEFSPAQHELVPNFEAVSVAADHNQLTMELMQSIAGRHNMVCILHEKPFDRVNGSGKHNNWSLATDKGENLFNPGETPAQNARFLLFLAAIIKAVDENQDVLRSSISSASNDLRLGACEAPPPIISIFLGEELTQILEAVASGRAYHSQKKTQIEIGVSALPFIPMDTTDRNRTSPMAFTGNKFEFRMCGSKQSIADPNIALNTMVADSLCHFADALEKATDFNSALSALIKDTIKKHKRIIFNGNNYSEEWRVEAQKRGLLNIANSVEAMQKIADKKNIKLFSKHGVFSEQELVSRQEIEGELYCKIIHVEALTMTEMVKVGIIPAIVRYQKQLLDVVNLKANMSLSSAPEYAILAEICTLNDALFVCLNELEELLNSPNKNAQFYCQYINTKLKEIRTFADKLEALVAKDCWPYPSYGDILYSVK